MSNQSFEVELTKAKSFKEIPVESFMGNDGWARSFMQKNHDKIKMNQLRNFFNEINKIKGEFNTKEKVRLETNLAYDYGRNVITQEFHDIISRSLAKTNSDEDFKNFVEFIESLIAYHKYFTKAKGE